MLVIGAGVVALLLFVALTEAARRGSQLAHATATLEAVILTPLAGLGAFAALVLMSLKCDDGCAYEGTPDWWHTVGAWQWTGQFAVALVGLIGVVSTVALLRLRNHRWAAAAMTLGAAAFGGWAAFVAPLGDGLGL